MFTEENYKELYEAVYVLEHIDAPYPYKPVNHMEHEALLAMGVHESVYTAALRIMVVAGFLSFDGNVYTHTRHFIKEHAHVARRIGHQHYACFYEKAKEASRFFFNTLSEEEYDIYSRCNYPVTYETGKSLASFMSFKGKRVLELGGNSGGFASALLDVHAPFEYTLVDAKIPCDIGREYSHYKAQAIMFIEGNIFDLKIPQGPYDYIVCCNLLHDFDDERCLAMLEGGLRHSHSETRLVIVEDTLEDAFHPVERVIHGLRLAVECRGGRQRTYEEMALLISRLELRLERKIPLNPYHTAMVFA